MAEVSIEWPYCVLDVESGGTDPRKHSLLTVCFRLLDRELNDGPQISFGIKHAVYNVTPEAMAVNKIDLEEHHKTAWDDSRIAGELGEFFGFVPVSECGYARKHTITLIGHNPAFDKGFIDEQLPMAWPQKRNGEYVGISTSIFHYRLRDTQAVGDWMNDCGLIDVEKPSLSKLCALFGIEYKAHTADGDVDATAKLWRAYRKLGKKYLLSMALAESLHRNEPGLLKDAENYHAERDARNRSADSLDLAITPNFGDGMLS